jgi:negative regulator of sigma E activity
MSHDWESVSAYFDGELDGSSEEAIKRRLSEDGEVKETFERFAQLHDTLRHDAESDPALNVAESAERTWRRIQTRIAAFSDYSEAGVPDARHREHGTVSLPLPLAVAATLLLVASFTMAVWLSARETARSPAAAAGDSQPVNVTIEVDDMTAEQLVQWLHQEDMLGELTVNLPSSPQFRLMGEPELIKVGSDQAQLEALDSSP